MTDLLDPSALLHVLQQLLPPSSDAQLRNPSDALSAMIHTIMIRLDFRLTGLSEDDRLPSSTSESAETDATSHNKLPAEWNAKGPDHYSFRYKHHQSSLDYLVKVVKLGNKAVIHGIAMQGSKTSTLEIPLSDYFSPSFFPYPQKHGETEPLVNGFIGSSRVKDLVIAFKTKILQTLVPGLRKDGYTEESSSNTGTGSSSSSTQPGRSNPPPRQPRAPFAGDEDDPSDPSTVPPFRNPLSVGDRDLDPLGGSPLRLPPRFGGGSGGAFAPPPLFPGGDTGGGMYVGPDHPMFRNRFPPPNHPGAGPTGLPPGAVPPGARFDPIYPGGGPGGIGGGGGRFDPFNPDNPDVGGARPQGMGGPGSGEPDWDDFAPPRAENPFGGGRGGGRGGFGGFGGGRGGRGGPPDTSGWYA